MKNMISTISNNYGVSEVSRNCIINPTQENNFLCCYRTTLISEKVRISFDGYCDVSCLEEGATPKNIMDNARSESIQQVRDAWSVLTKQVDHQEEIIDIDDPLSLEFEAPERRIDIVPDVYRKNKYNERLSDNQYNVVYAVAKHNRRNPDAFVQEKLGKSISELTKGEVSFLSNTYGIQR